MNHFSGQTNFNFKLNLFENTNLEHAHSISARHP